MKLTETNREIDALMSLPDNWDSYGGAAPSKRTCALSKAVARSMHRAFDCPQVVPVCDGSILLEWHTSNFDIEINIEAKDGQTGTFNI